MKKMLFAAVLALVASTNGVFGSVVTYTDETKYDTDTRVTFPPPKKYVMGGPNAVMDVPPWREHEGTNVVGFGPPTGGL